MRWKILPWCLEVEKGARVKSSKILGENQKMAEIVRVCLGIRIVSLVFGATVSLVPV